MILFLVKSSCQTGASQILFASLPIAMLSILLCFYLLHIASSLVILNPATETIAHTAAAFGWYYGNATIMGRVEESEPFDACSQLVRNMENKIVLATRGWSTACSFEEKVKNVVPPRGGSFLD